MKDVEEGKRLDSREDEDEHYEGPWWRFPPMRNALFSGILLAVGFVLSYTGTVSSWVPLTHW